MKWFPQEVNIDDSIYRHMDDFISRHGNIDIGLQEFIGLLASFSLNKAAFANLNINNNTNDNDRMESMLREQ